MFLFLVLGIPVFAWIAAYVLFDDRGLGNLGDAAKGAVSAAVLLLPLQLLDWPLPLTIPLIYVKATLSDVAFPMVTALAAYLLVYRKSVGTSEAGGILFFGAYFEILAIYTFFSRIRGLDSYVLFVLPFVWMLAVWILAYWGSAFAGGGLSGRILVGILLSVYAAVLGGVLTLYRINYSVLAYLAIAIVATATYFLLARPAPAQGRRRRGP